MIKYVFILLVFILSACHGFIEETHIVGKYYLIAVDASSDRTVCYQVPNSDGFLGLIEQYVSEVRFNEQWIIARQEAKRNDPKYFIIPVVENFNWEPEELPKGPFTWHEMKKQLSVYNIPYEKLKIIN